MLIAIGAWLVTALLCYSLLRRAIFNFGDPLIFENLAVPFSAALLAVLCATEFVPADKMTWFGLILLGYLLGARAATTFIGLGELRRAIVHTVGRLSKGEIYFILLATLAITIVFTALAIQSGGTGDGRTEFTRTFRPLAIIRGGLFLFSLLVLLSPKLTAWQVGIWLAALVFLSIPFSGKGVFVPVFYWAGVRFFIADKKASLGTLFLLGSVMLGGVAIMGMLAYGASSAGDVLSLIGNRFWLYGDVYIYAYKLDALSMIRGDYKVSFMSYMLHPITSLVGIRGYEKPLGSMIMSQAMHADVLTGPNPQLPVLLDFFFPNAWATGMAISCTLGVLVFSIRAGGIRLTYGRSRYLAMGGVAAAIFGPAAGFVDTSQVLIALVGIVVVTVLACIAEIALARPRRTPAESTAVPLSEFPPDAHQNA